MKLHFFLILLILYRVVRYQVFADTKDFICPPFTVIKHDDRCLWTMPGGNLKVSEHGCGEYGGSIFIFNQTEEALKIMDKLDISRNTPVFIGAMLNELNDSMHYDWLRRPGTWDDKMDANVTPNKDFAAEDGTLCLVLSERSIIPTNCSSEMTVTVCEKENIVECPCAVHELIGDTSALDPTTSTHLTSNAVIIPTSPSMIGTTADDVNSSNVLKPMLRAGLIHNTSTPPKDDFTSEDSDEDTIYTTHSLLTIDRFTEMPSVQFTSVESNSLNDATSEKTQMPPGASIKPSTLLSAKSEAIVYPTSLQSTHSVDDLHDAAPMANATSLAEDSLDDITGTNSSKWAQIDPSEMIPVPGPNGTDFKTLSEIISHVIAHTNTSNNSNTSIEADASEKTPVLVPCGTENKTNTDITVSMCTPSSPNTATPAMISSTSFQESSSSSVSDVKPTPCPIGYDKLLLITNTGCHNQRRVVNLSETLHIPSPNGTRDIQVGDLFKEILGKINMTQISGPGASLNSNNILHGNTSGLPVVHGNTSGLPVVHGNTSGLPVEEMKFQVSGDNTGSVGPFHGGSFPPLLIDKHTSSAELLKNVSRIFKELREESEVDISTLEVFVDAVKMVVEDEAISEERQNLKKYLLNDIMRIAEYLMDSLSNPDEVVHIATEVIDMKSHVVKPITNDSHVDIDAAQNTRTQVKLSTSIFQNHSISVRVSTVYYKKMGTIVNGSNDHISSRVMAVSVHYIIGNTTRKAKVSTNGAIIFVMRTFLKKERRELERQCSHWSFPESQWSTVGCSVLAQNSSHTTCECNHLTNFAILVMYMEQNDVSPGNKQALFTLTTVGCSISIACLVMAMITYFYLNMLSNEKILIHANLSLALMLAQLVFVSSSDAHRNATACKVVAVLLHFFFMASFTWMMVEGIALYLCCAKGIFNHRDMRVKYFLLGWGLPAIIVVVSLAAQFPNYGNGPQYSCWLSVKDGLIWAFLGPMLVIVLLNMLVMGLVVKTFLTLKTISQKTEVARLRGSIRAMFTLLPLLGLTWIFSLLVPFSVVFHYFFVIINTVQGMCIFFFHCICNDEIRKKFHEKRRRWSTTRTASDAEMNYPRGRKRGSFDAVKAATSVEHNDRRSAWT